MALNTPEVRLLVSKAQGELPYKQSAFESLAKLSYPNVRRTARAITGNDDLAQTVTQEVLLRVFHGISKLEDPIKYGAWLRKVTVNACNTLLAKERREVLKRQAFHKDLKSGPVQKSELDSFDQLVGELSVDERTIVAFKILEDMEFKEIADIIGATTSAAKMRYYRALDKIKNTNPDIRSEG